MSSQPISRSKVLALAVPVMLEIGREAVFGIPTDTLLQEVSEEIIAEATG